jgi:hypothetical protein
MLWVPNHGGILRCEHNTGTVGASTLGTAVTTSGTATVKGTPVELITSTSFDAYWIKVLVSDYGAANTNSRGCLDILLGASTEFQLIPNLLIGNAQTFAGGFAKVWDFPLHIPAGSRIAAAACGDRLSTALRVAVFLYGGSGVPWWPVGTKVVTYGGSQPAGVNVTPGGSGAEGAWTQITASTNEVHFALVPCIQVNDTTMTGSNYAVDLGVGAATEEEVAQSYWFTATNNEVVGGPLNSMPCFRHIPNASRLAMRASDSAAIDSGFQAAIHAVS